MCTGLTFNSPRRHLWRASCFWLSLLSAWYCARSAARVHEELLLAVALISAFVGVARAAPPCTPCPPSCLPPWPASAWPPSSPSVFPSSCPRRNPAQTRWMFAIAGSGQRHPAMGHRATRGTYGSLHTGLLVPLMALGLMLVMMRCPVRHRSFRTVFPSPSRAPASTARNQCLCRPSKRL